MNLPQQPRAQRPARIRPAEFTPVVLRVGEGSCTAELEVFSLTGGLLTLPKLLSPGSHVKLMFLTGTGPVLGVAEMLRPVSWTSQPFRFVALHENDHRRLRSATETAGTAAATGAPDPMRSAPQRYALPPDTALVPPNNILLPKTIPTPEPQSPAAAPSAVKASALPDSAPRRLEPSIPAPQGTVPGTAAPSRNAPAVDPDQQWIAKYRAALTHREPKRKPFFRMFLGVIIAVTLGLGATYTFYVQLLR